MLNNEKIKTMKNRISEELQEAGKTAEVVKRNASVHTTIKSFKNAIEKVTLLDLVSDESKQKLREIKDEAVNNYINQIKL